MSVTVNADVVTGTKCCSCFSSPVLRSAAKPASLTMASQRSSTESSDAFVADAEKENLVFHHDGRAAQRKAKRPWTYSRAHLLGLYASNLLLLVFCSALVWKLAHRPFQDPTAAVYCTSVKSKSAMCDS